MSALDVHLDATGTPLAVGIMVGAACGSLLVLEEPGPLHAVGNSVRPAGAMVVGERDVGGVEHRARHNGPRAPDRRRGAGGRGGGVGEGGDSGVVAAGAAAVDPARGGGDGVGVLATGYGC
ncbi:hypothetical protein PG997_013049 [Apiospora hydei]|uniref:Uncharacterized protein n=1 Tax=Apiospora hydei TaxID=1337664 RepID=A0ABR1V528_9PEZI